MPDWVVANEAPAPGFTDPATGFSTDVKTDDPSKGPHPRGLMTALIQYPWHVVSEMAALPKRALDAATDYTPGTNDVEGARGLIGPALETSATMAGVHIPFAPRGAVGIFGGKLAAGADRAALAKAEQMTAQGADRTTVWSETGWHQGTDGAWRFEIPDQGAAMRTDIDWGPKSKIAGYKKRPLEDVLQHDELYKNYPELRQLEVWNHGDPTSGAWYTRAPKDLTEPGSANISFDAKSPDALSILLHELQHGVQQKEGFASGGTPGHTNIGGPSSSAFGHVENPIDAIPAVANAEERAYLAKEAMRSYDMLHMRKIERAPGEQEASDAHWQPIFDAAQKEANAARRQAYLSTAGEVEARNVQERAGMGHNSRRGIAPWESADTPTDKQILLSGGIPIPVANSNTAWTITKEEPTAPTALSTADEWKPVAETPAGDWRDKEAAANLAATPQTAAEGEQPQGRGIWQAIKDYPAHFVEGLINTAKYPGDVMSGKREENTGDTLNLALMGGVKMGKTVGGAPLNEPVKPAEVASKVEAAPLPTADPLAPPEPIKTMNADVKPDVISEPLKPAAEPLAHPEATPEQMNSAQKAARVIKNIFIPDEVSPMAEDAAGSIRSAGGKAARDTETTRATLDAQQAKVSALSEQDKLGLIDYIERRSKDDAPAIQPDLVPVADAVRDAMKQRQTKLEALDSTEKARFVEDYYTHLWKDPEAAQKLFSGPAKEGSGRNLKERSIPTVAEGIARGLEPVSTDPLETTMRYVQNMDRFIATNEVIDKGLKDGVIKHYMPGEQPSGWVEINSRRGSTNPIFAPEDWARVYNNFVDRGIHANKDWGNIYDGVRNTSNAITSLELGLSGFHATTMAQEAMVNSVARGIGQLASGKPLKALRSMVETPFSPVINTVIGRDLEHVYLGKKRGDPLMRQITDLLTEAGGRAKGTKHAPDYQYTQAGSYWDSFKRGSVLAEIKAAGSDIKNAPLTGPIKVLATQVGRVMQTVAKPLFEYTIPKMKNGAFYDNMSAWLDANPTADKAMQVKAARKIWDSIDNRFGEVVQDNIFWNKTMKQALQVGLRSYSWTFGTLQEIGGGAKDLIRHPSSLSPKSQHYSPKASYVIALPIVYATLNAVYQKLKTGQDPESIQDVMRGGLTGGTQPGVGGRGTVKERSMMPGYMKDVFGWYEHPKDEAYNKMATGPRMAFESIRNKDWKDQPIRDKNAPALSQVQQYLKYVYQSLGPISVKQIMKGNKTGSNIGTGEQMLGVRPAPAFLQDPSGYDKMMKGIGQRDWQKKERYDKKQDRQYNGPQ